MGKGAGWGVALLVAAAWTSTATWAGVGLESFVVVPSVARARLFRSISPETPGAEPTIAQSWPVVVDFALLATLPAQIEVNFPDRGSVTLTRGRTEARGPGSFMWRGRGDDCSAVFTALGGVLEGTLHCANDTYGVRLRPGTQQLVRFDATQIPDENEPEAVPNTNSPLTEAGTGALPALQGNDDVIDVLVLYTPGVCRGLAASCRRGRRHRKESMTPTM